MRARSALLLLLAGVLAAVVGTVVWLTLDTPDRASEPTVVRGDGAVASDDGGAGATPRRHVGDGPVETDPESAAPEPEGPATKAQRLQWIREWLEIACGQGYGWSDRQKAVQAILQFDEAESVPLILEIAMVDDIEAGGWGWAMQILGRLGPRGSAAVPDLMRLLRRDEDRGFAASYALGQIGAASVDPLLASLAEDPAEVQARALYALTIIRDPPRRLTQTLVEFADHADANLRAYAVGGLSRNLTAPDIVVPALIGALADEDETVRWQAVLALHHRAADAAPAVGALRSTLDDPDVSVSFWAAKTLGRIGPAAGGVTDKLISLLAADPERWAEAIPEALSGIGTSALLTALDSPSAKVRVLSMPFLPGAVEADASTAQAAVAALDSALVSEDADVRRTAVEALGAMGPTASATVPSLLKLAEDGDGRVRRAALIASVRVGGARQKVLDVLVRELADGPDIARMAAAEALGALGPDAVSAVDALAAAMNDPDLVVRERAARALESVGSGAITAASALAGRLSDDSERVRLAAAVALIAVDPPGLAARDTIGKLRISDEPLIRRRLIEGLGRHANAVWLDVVLNRVDDRDVGVRIAAAQSLAKYTAHSPTVVPALIARLEKERHSGVQMNLIQALGAHGKDAAEAVPLLERIAANERALVPVRDAVEEALTRLR